MSRMLRYMPDEVFIELAKRGSVGLFTAEESTTIFPEYENLADRPECEGEWRQDNLSVRNARNYQHIRHINSYSARNDFSRQNLKSEDVKC